MEEYTAGHDEYLDDNIEMCSSCKEEGRTIAAVRYCVDCEEYQCHRCFKSHQRYNNKDHEVYDETSRQKWGSKKPVKLPTARCPTHVGEVLQIFCEDHDALCCHVCVAMTHSHCKRKQYIPEVAKDIAIGNQEFITLKNDIDKVQTHLQEVVGESQKNKESIQKSRESFKNLLQKNRQQLEAMYTRVEQQTSTDLSRAHDSIDAEVDEKIKLGNELIAELEGLRVRIDPDSNTNDSQLFIGMKQMKGNVKLIHKKVELVSKPQPTGIECTTASAVSTFLNFEDNLLRQQQKNSKCAETDHLPWAQRTSKDPEYSDEQHKNIHSALQQTPKVQQTPIVQLSPPPVQQYTPQIPQVQIQFPVQQHTKQTPKVQEPLVIIPPYIRHPNPWQRKT